MVNDMFIFAGPPHAPEGATLLTSSTSQSLGLHWRPGYHGGYPPQWFVLQYKAVEEDTFSTYNDSLPSTDSMTVTVTGLQPQTNYTLQLFARNSRPPGGDKKRNHARSSYVILSGLTRRKIYCIVEVLHELYVC